MSRFDLHCGLMGRLVLVYLWIVPLLLFISESAHSAVIQISNITDLQKIGRDPSYPLDGEYELTQDIDASDTMIWNNGAGFLPIGSGDYPFIGMFDGKGYVIRNLYINRGGGNYVGLFGYVGSGGEVRNLGLENVWLMGGSYVGSLVGFNRGTVSQCYSTGSVSGSLYTSGLVGYNDGGTVSQCYSTGSVSARDYVGGLVGRNNAGIVFQSHTMGSVWGNGSNVGGLVGYNGGTVSQCYYSTGSGSVWGNGNKVGGLVGYNDKGTVLKCYSTGSVSGGYYVGGLVGYNGGTVSQCYYSTEGVSGNSGSVGGLAGYNSGTVSQCYSTGSVSGAYDVGGLVGRNSGTVAQCYSMGRVSGSGSYVGGLVGGNSGKVEGSYWNVETSGQSSSAGGVGKTTAEMKQRATYINWDFANVWDIVEAQSYPYLRALGPTQEPEGEGVVEGTPEGTPEGEGVVEGTPEGTPEGEGVVEGTPEGTPEGEGVAEGTPEGTPEGEGVIEGTPEGTPEGEGEVYAIVPYVVGLDEESATTAILEAALHLGVVTYICNDIVPTEYVIDQLPEGGRAVEVGSSVDLWVSTGPCPPEGEGISEGEGVVEGTPEGTPEGEGAVEGTPEGTPDGEGVVEGTPEGTPEGEGVIEGTPEGTPDGEGLVEGTPEGTPEGEGVVEGTPEGTPEGEGVVEGTPEGTPEGEGVVEGTPEGTPEGEGVVEGTPEGTPEGEGVVEGTPEGEIEKVVVPYVIGFTEEEATNTIISRGLIAGTIRRECSDTVPQGYVIAQNPLPAEVVNKGTPVSLTVSTGSCPVTVPNVVGMSEQDARTKIVVSGLTVGDVSYEYSDTVPEGKVISQSPGAGSKVPKETLVDLVVSKGKKRRFIVSCGTDNSTSNSSYISDYISDLLFMGIVCGVILLQGKRVSRLRIYKG